MHSMQPCNFPGPRLHRCLVQALDNIKHEQLALEDLKDKAAKLCADKRTALRKLENQAIERKNRCDQQECLWPLLSQFRASRLMSSRLQGAAHLS